MQNGTISNNNDSMVINNKNKSDNMNMENYKIGTTIKNIFTNQSVANEFMRVHNDVIINTKECPFTERNGNKKFELQASINHGIFDICMNGDYISTNYGNCQNSFYYDHQNTNFNNCSANFLNDSAFKSVNLHNNDGKTVSNTYDMAQTPVDTNVHEYKNIKNATTYNRTINIDYVSDKSRSIPVINRETECEFSYADSSLCDHTFFSTLYGKKQRQTTNCIQNNSTTQNKNSFESNNANQEMVEQYYEEIKPKLTYENGQKMSKKNINKYAKQQQMINENKSFGYVTLPKIIRKVQKRKLINEHMFNDNDEMKNNNVTYNQMQKRKLTDEHIQNYNDEMKYNDGTYSQVQKRKSTDEYLQIDNGETKYNDGTYINFTQKAEYNDLTNNACKNTEKIRNIDPTYYDCDSQHNKVSCTNNLHEGHNVKNNCFKPHSYDSNIIKEAYNNNQNNIYYNGKVKDITKQTLNRSHQNLKYHIKSNKLANNRSNNSFNSNNFLQSMEKQIENYKLKAKIHGWDDAKSAMININKSKIHDDMAQITTNTNQNEANVEITNNQIDINECTNDYNCGKNIQNFSAKICDNKLKNKKTSIIKNRCKLAKRKTKKNSKKYKRNIVIEKDNSVNNCLDLSLFRKKTFVPIYLSCKTNYKHSSTRVDFIKALSYFNLYYNIKMPCCSYFERLHEMIIFCMMNGGFMKVYKTKTLNKIVRSKKVILKYFLYVYPFEQYRMNASIIEVYEMRRSSCILNVKYTDTVNKIELLQKFLNINNFVEINKILKKIEEKSIEKPLYDFILNLAFTLTKKIFENKNIENNIYTFQEFIVKKNTENEILKKIANKEITKSEIRTIKKIQINEIRTSLKFCSFLILAYITIFTNNHAVTKNSCNQDCLLALQKNNYSESLNIKDLNRLIFTLFKYKNRCENEMRSILFENAFKAFEKLYFLYDFDCNMYKNTKNYINERKINSVFSYLSKTTMSKNIKRKIINKTTKYFDHEFNRIANMQQNEVGSFDFNFHEQIVKFTSDIKRYRVKMVGITEKLIYNYNYTRNNETAVILEHIFSVLIKYMKQPEIVKIKEYIAKSQTTKFDHYFTNTC